MLSLMRLVVLALVCVTASAQSAQLGAGPYGVFVDNSDGTQTYEGKATTQGSGTFADIDPNGSNGSAFSITLIKGKYLVQVNGEQTGEWYIFTQVGEGGCFTYTKHDATGQIGSGSFCENRPNG